MALRLAPFAVILVAAAGPAWAAEEGDPAASTAVAESGFDLGHLPTAPRPAEAQPAAEPTGLITRTVVIEEGRRRAPTWKDVRTLELAFQALNLIDLAQSATCVSNGRCSEGNPILGRHPSLAALVGLKLGTGALHFALTRWLLADHPGAVKPYLYSSIALQGGVVGWNMQYMF